MVPGRKSPTSTGTGCAQMSHQLPHHCQRNLTPHRSVLPGFEAKHCQCTDGGLHGLAIDVGHTFFDFDAHGAERVRPVQAVLCCASTRQLIAFVDVGPMKRTYRISQVHSHLQTRCSHVGRDRLEGAQCWRYCCWTVMSCSELAQPSTGCLSSIPRCCVFSQYRCSSKPDYGSSVPMAGPDPQEPVSFSGPSSTVRARQMACTRVQGPPQRGRMFGLCEKVSVTLCSESMKLPRIQHAGLR